MKSIGVDIGTTTICAVVVDEEDGRILDTVTQQNQALICSEQPWERIQDPAVILQQVEGILAGLSEKHAPLSGIGFTGQMHGIVYIDATGNAVSPLVTWQDGRGDLPYREGYSYAGYMSAASGYKLATGYGAVTHFYNGLHGLIPETAKFFCTIHDYAAMKLSGGNCVRLHPSDAASLGFYKPEEKCFDRQAIRALGMEDRFFPEISEELELAGSTLQQVPVAVAIGDNQASFLGAVKEPEDSISVNIGTSSQISVYTGSYRKNSPVETRPFADSGYLLVGSPLCGGRSYALLEEFFRSVVRLATGQEVPRLYDKMDAAAFEFLATDARLEISTKFSGTRENPAERGYIRNLGTGNFTAGHFIVGVLEGMVKELHDIYEVMLPCLSSTPKRLVCSGNGVRMNKPLQKILSEAFGMPLSIPLYREEAAYGAALYALAAAGCFESTAQVQQLIRYE